MIRASGNTRGALRLAAMGLLLACAGERPAAAADVVAPAAQAFFDGCVDTAPSYSRAPAVFAAAGISTRDEDLMRQPASVMFQGESCAVFLRDDHDAETVRNVANLLSARSSHLGRVKPQPGGPLSYAAEYFIDGDKYVVTVSKKAVVAGMRATVMTLYPRPN